MKMKKLVAMFCTMTIIMGMLGGCGEKKTADTSSSGGDAAKTQEQNKDSKSAETVVLKAAHVLPETHAYHKAWLKVAEEVKEKTNGGLQIDVFANSTLGNERDIIEGMQLGTVDLSCMSTGALAGFSKTFLALDLPFMFESREDAYKVLDSEIGENMLSVLDNNGLKGFCYWENGFRNLSNNKHEVIKPEDVKGLKIRTLENELQMFTFTTLGASAIPMAWSEVYTACQQGTIDGQENPLANIYLNKIHEVNPYISMTGHFYAAAPVIMSKKTFDSLSPEYQKILVTAIKDTTEFERQLCIEGDKEYMESLKNEGAKISENIDKGAWRAAVQPVYDKYEGEIGKELIQQMKDKIAE